MSGLLFLDSGSFSLKREAETYRKENPGCDVWDYYHSDAHFRYLDDYADFIKQYGEAIDYYANVDVIRNAELSWRNLRYLEDEHKLTPVPVLHNDCDSQWIRKHLEYGYDFIAV